MSLAVLAQNLASKGRNGDTMLVHMTPGEVQGLHALALAHGGKLTINPDTGLPEANFLKRLLPMIAGMALNAFLPGVGTAIGAALGGLSGAVGTGILVGGVTGLARGSLKEGILAGLGAYGGASLASGLAGASGAQGTAGALGVEGAATGAGSQAAMLAEQTAGFGSEGLQKLAEGAAYAKGAAPSLTPAFTEGIKALGTEPGRASFMKEIGGKTGLYKAGAAALAPGMLEEPVKTTTPRTESYKMYRRPMAFNQETQTFEPLPITSATETTPGGMNSGGIVALADGGNTQEFATAGTYFPNYLGLNAVAAGQPEAVISKNALSGYDYAAATPQNEREKQINQIYNQVLGRQAEQEGLKYWAGTDLSIPDIQRQIQGIAKDIGVKVDPTQLATPTAAQLAAQQSILADPQAAALSAAKSGLAAGMTDQQIADMVNMQYGKSFSAQNVADFLKAQGLTRVPVFDVAPITDVFPEVPNTTPGTAVTGTPAIDYTAAPKMETVRSDYVKGGGRTDMPTITNILPTDRTYTQNQAFALLQGYLQSNPNALYGDVVAFARSKGIPDMQAKAAYNEFRFNSLTGASQRAYDYLMGRAPYQAGRPEGSPPIMKPYAESVGLAPQGFYAGRKMVTDSSGNVSPVSSSGTSSSGAKVQWRNEATGELVDSTENDPKYKDNPEWRVVKRNARGGLMDIASAAAARGGNVQQYNLGGYSDGGRLLRGPGDGVSDSIPATIGNKQPARLADGEFVVPARIVSEIGNGSTEAGARKLYAMMDRVQRARAKTTGKGRVAKDTKADKYLPA